ncbi:MAG: orotidine-5'-phosphate decarboxylase [Proteobacteria bacterium]|nr:orotidine-5'-phosphate decarboxylase [Pseudomonadota bacterium]
MKTQSRLCVALDLENKNDCFALIDKIQALPIVVKVGLRLLPFFTEADWKKIRDKKLEFFLDAKLHDIPTQVESSVKAWCDLGASFLTLHLSGGRKMLELASRAREGSSLRLLGVSVLTSLSQKDIEELNFGQNSQEVVSRWAKIAFESGVDSFVSSVAEVPAIRALQASAYCCCPGIRMPGEAVHSDQNRSYEVQEAVAQGVNLLVVGRSVLKAKDPRAQIEKIISFL